MVATCAVSDCPNSISPTANKENINRAEIDKIHFHRFPKDFEVKQEWVRLCRRQDRVNSSTARLCSAHFLEEDYERDLQHELLGLPLRIRLKSDAVPSVFANRPSQMKPKNDSRDARAKNRSRKSLIKDILAQHDKQLEISGNDTSPPEEPVKIKITQTEVRCKDIVKLENDLQRARQSNAKMKLKLQRQEIQIASLRKRLLRKKSMPVKQSKAIKFVQKNKKWFPFLRHTHGRWPSSDIVRALQVRSVSLKAYETAREIYKLPLPSPRTLRRWAKNFSCSAGILTEILQIMQCQAESMPLHKRACALLFDEMSVMSKVVLDKSEDKLVHNSKVQVVMARGLFDSWKQPVYFEFDEKMTQETLFKIIQRLEESGFPVHCIICNPGAENRSLLKTLDIGLQNSKFNNPAAPKRSIFVFADVPHMLKLIRNHLIDDGVQLANETRIELSDLETLLESDNSELQLCPKFSRRHLEVVGAERMRVRPAAQLLSHHVATLCVKSFPDKPEIGQFFKTLNDGFDILNSRLAVDHSNSMKSAFRFSTEQIQILNNLKSLLLSMRFLSHQNKDQQAVKLSHYLPCQIGFVVSINSIQEMFGHLKAMYNMEYLMTNRCNQDSLESLFSRIRGIGGPNLHPTPVEFKYRLRLILLGGSYKCPQGGNVENDDEISIMSAGLVQKNKLDSESLQLAPPPKSRFSIKDDRLNDEESLLYLAGYLAWRMKRIGAGIYGTRARTRKSSKSWISMLSKGGLLTPTAKMHDWIKNSNKYFIEFMNEQGTCKNISTKLHHYISKHVKDMDPTVLREFVKIRLKIRISYLNQLRRQKPRVNCRKAKQFSNSSLK